MHVHISGQISSVALKTFSVNMYFPPLVFSTLLSFSFNSHRNLLQMPNYVPHFHEPPPPPPQPWNLANTFAKEFFYIFNSMHHDLLQSKPTNAHNALELQCFNVNSHMF